MAGSKNDSPLFWLEKHESFGIFSILRRKSVSAPQLYGVCMGRSGTSAYAAYALFSHFCYIGGFGHLGDPVLPTLRGVSGDAVIVYAYYDTKRRFLFFLGPLTTGAKDAK